MRSIVCVSALASFLVVGCDAKKDPRSTTGTTSAPATPPVAAKSRAVLPQGPCASDADCNVYLDACDCSCTPALGKLPPSALAGWNECLDGGAPRNCGAASPCASLVATCDAGTKTCVSGRK